MSLVDLSKYSSSELRDIQKQIDKEIQERRKEEKKAAQQELKMVAQKYGLSVEELVGGGAKKAGAKGSVKYRHPDDPSKTWSGRGRKPHWVKEWEAAGKSLDELAG